MARYLYSELSNAIQARQNCARTNNIEWFDKWSGRLAELGSKYLPSGSGFDAGTKLDWDASHAEKLVFHTAFHHMQESGMYDGWTEHTVTVTPSFTGINIRVSGRNRNDIKDHIAETFHHALRSQEIEPLAA